MSMTSKSPFENMSVSTFRKQLWQVGRDIDHVLEANGLEGDEAQSLKVVALRSQNQASSAAGRGVPSLTV